jgi:glutamine synthetase
VGKVESALYHGENGSAEGHARHFKEAVLPPMQEVRTAADALEGLVADDLWPLPTYQEMLFIR